MMPRPELKPCPFCGAFGAFVRMECPTMWVECRFCGAHGPFACGETMAAEAWNARADIKAFIRESDRPTCHLVEDEDGYTACSECGCTALCMRDAVFCPSCGALVIHKEENDGV